MDTSRIEIADETLIKIQTVNSGLLCFEIPYGLLKLLTPSDILKYKHKDNSLYINSLQPDYDEEANDFTNFMDDFDNVEQISDPEHGIYGDLIESIKQLKELLNINDRKILVEEVMNAMNHNVDTRGINTIEIGLTAYESLERVVAQINPQMQEEWGMTEEAKEVLQKAINNKEQIWNLIREVITLNQKVEHRIFMQNMNKLNRLKFKEI